MDDSEQPYKIDGQKVWLSPTAREWAHEWFGPGRQGERKMAQHLLNEQHETQDVPPDVLPSESVEES